jgi:hypothetical protein
MEGWEVVLAVEKESLWGKAPDYPKGVLTCPAGLGSHPLLSSMGIWDWEQSL